MLKVFRNQGKALRWIMGFILFLVAASMIITLVPNVFGPADGTGETLAEVNGSAVTVGHVDAELRQYRTSEMPPQALSMMAGNVLQNLISERVLFSEASNLGLVPTEEDVAEFLRDQLSDVLFPDGKFVGATAYEGFVRQQFRRTVAEFEREILYNLAIEVRLRRMVTDGVSVSDEEVRRRFHQENDRVKIEWAALDSEALRSEIDATPEALLAYFEGNQLRYRQPERRPLQLLTVRPDDAAEDHEVTDAEIELYYAQNQYRFEQPERVKVRHILFMADDEGEDGALREAEDVLRQVRDGADFEAMAAEHSDDPGNAQNGGDLGWVSQGMMDPAFEEASFALDVGELSVEPVKSDFGYHLIRVDDRESGSVKALSEVRDVIRGDLLAEKSQNDRYALMEGALEAAQQSAGALQSVADRMGLPFAEFDPFSRSELPAALPASSALVEAVFSQPVGEVFTATQEDTLYIGFSSEAVPARDSEYEEVSETVRQDYVQAEAANLGRERAEELAQGARDADGNLAAAAQRSAVAVNTSDFVRRDGDLAELGPVTALGEDVFAEEVGEVRGPVSVGSRWVVFRSLEQEAADESALATEGDALRETLLNEKRNQLFEYFRQQKVREYSEKGAVIQYGDRIQAYLGLMQDYT